MTHTDFHAWLTYHRAKYPGLGKHFAAIAAEHTRHDDSPSLDDVMTSWFRSLNRASLEDAKRATDIMGDDTPEPKGWDRHPMAIAAICRKLRGEGGTSSKPIEPRYVDGEQVYKCATCRDSGWVFVWSVEAMRAAIAGTPVRNAIYVQSVARCTCRAAIGHDKGAARFNAKSMLPFTRIPADGSEPADLVEFMVGRGGRHSEFDQFGG